MDYNNLLKDQTALITAGADGIGYGIAKRFEEAGAKVFVCDINEDAVNKVNLNHTNIKAMVCDLRQTQLISSMVEAAFEYLGKLNIIVNNAGIPMRRTPEALSEEDFDLVFSINVRSLLMLTIGLAEPMKQRGGGSIVNISSVASLRGPLGRVAYAGTKGAVDAMTRALATDWGNWGIRVNSICPGLIATAIWEGDRNNVPGLIERMENNIALKRWGFGDDIADVVLFFASEASRYVTGEVIAVDGGMAHIGAAPRE